MQTDPDLLYKSLFWTPRVLCILFAIFLSIFAADVFGEGRGFWETVLALLMHLTPSGMLLIVLAIAWRWEWVGAVVFLALAVLYLIFAWARQFHWSAYVAISGPLLLIGILFLVNWFWRQEIHESVT
jgi:lysylphosphatidylglycerol synthetase-like protein (DUF2156 family)|tara:strand:+ start:16653 stop:17033 length:381 start_codon:yes stop_codon:yes gene_type:complete